MRVVVILAHPKADSFSHAIAQTAADELRSLEHEVSFRDLYAERFDPVLPREELDGPPLDARLDLYLAEVRVADGFVIVHPNWWGQPPAILKGWVDRVLRPGVAYEFRAGDDPSGVPVGLLRARAALILNTSNTPPAREASVFGDPLEVLWRNCIFHLCGVDNVRRRTFSTIAGGTAEERADWLRQVASMVATQFPAECAMLK